MPKLTKRLLKALEPGDAEAFIWDAEVKGFGVRVKTTGAASFVLKYRIGTATRRFTIGKVGSPHTVETARIEAKRLLADVAAGKDPGEAKAAARAELTVSQLADAYLLDGPAMKPNKKASSWATDRIVLSRHIVPLLGTKLASRVTPEEVAKMQRDIAAGRTAVRQKTRSRGLARVTGGRRVAAMSLAVLSGAYTFAIATRRLRENPCLGVARLKNPPRERFLSEQEVAVLAEALADLEADRLVNAEMAAAIRVLMLTGARKSEITGLKFDWIDGPRRLLRLPDSKTGAKTIHLAPAALEILVNRPRTESGFVFPAARGEGPTIGVPRAWTAVKRRADAIAATRAADDEQPPPPTLMDVRLHDLRHTFASFAVADGASLFLIGKVLGHRNTATTEVYAHLRDDPLAAVADRTAEKIFAAMQVSVGPGAAVVELRPSRSGRDILTQGIRSQPRG